MKARYNRISTANQKLDRQLAKQNTDEKLYSDVISGGTPFAERPKGQELIRDIEQGKINYVVVSAIDRLGRNMVDIINTLDFFNRHNVTLRVDDLTIESRVKGQPNITFNLIISVMGNIAEMERKTLLERQREGIEEARKKGVYKGRVKGTTESDEEVLNKYKEIVKFLKMGKSLRDIKSRCKVSLGTVQKVKKILNKQATM